MSDENIRFDPEDRLRYPEPAKSVPKRRKLMIILASLLVVGVAVLSWRTYETVTSPKSPSSVPEIHSDTAPVKEAPANPGGMVVPDQDSALLNREGQRNPNGEQLLPPPEPALPRPAASAPAVQAAAPAPPPPAAAVAPALPSAPVPSPQAAVRTPAPPAAATTPAPPPAPAAPAAASAAPAAAGPGWRLQLGAVRSEAAAKAEWQRLKAAQPDLLGKLGLTTQRVDLGAKGTFYRIQAGPIADGAAAAQSCATLKSRHVGCLLVKP